MPASVDHPTTIHSDRQHSFVPHLPRNDEFFLVMVDANMAVVPVMQADMVEPGYREIILALPEASDPNIFAAVLARAATAYFEARTLHDRWQCDERLCVAAYAYFLVNGHLYIVLQGNSQTKTMTLGLPPVEDAAEFGDWLRDGIITLEAA